MKKLLGALSAFPLVLCACSSNDSSYELKSMAVEEETPVFITIGQSNADGSAEFDVQEDARLRQWYASADSNSHTMKIWYRSSYIVNQPDGSRWVFDGKEIDHQPGWLDLWYRNENDSNRTAMNMIHGYGTWSKSDDFASAQGRRGMEGEFGVNYQRAFPGKDLYIVKLGCSGSQISTWTSDDNHNWEYFYNNMWVPAMNDLLAQGKKPRLAGIWWMQGCGDQNKPADYYAERLGELIDKCRHDLGFSDAKIYIGQVVKPGESETNPNASAQFGQGVRDAQVAVTTPGTDLYRDRTVLIDSRNSPFQGDQLHFNHAGINRIGRDLAGRVIADGVENWASFSTPGSWSGLDTDSPVFVPAFGNPEITYITVDSKPAALLDYGTWSEVVKSE